LSGQDGLRSSCAGRSETEELKTNVFGERTIYDNEWVRLTLMDIEPPDGHRFEHHVVRLSRVAIAAVVNDADEVLMMWRHRFAVEQWGWELPGGIADD
jgi:8-oxo-dGDP phosphatase